MKKRNMDGLFKNISTCLLVWLMAIGFAFGQPPAEKKLELVFDKQQADPTAVVEISPDGKFVLIGGSESLVLWNFVTGSEKWRIRTPAEITLVKFSPDSKIFFVILKDNSFKIYDTEKGVLIRTSNEFTTQIVSMAISPDGTRLVTIEQQGRTRVWDVPTGKEVQMFEKMPNVTAVAFSPDGRYVITGHSDGVARLWNLEQDDYLIREYRGSEKAITSVAFGDALYYTRALEQFSVLTASLDGTVRLYEGRSGVESFRLVNGEAVSAIASSSYPDTLGVYLSYIAIGDRKGSIKLWKMPGIGARPASDQLPLIVDLNQQSANGASPDQTVKLTGHTDEVDAVAVTRNEKFILSHSLDSTTRIWDVTKRTEICKIVSFSGGDWAVINPEGRYDTAGKGHLKSLFWKFGDETILLSELREMYYEPNLLGKLLGYNSEPLRSILPLKDIKLYPEIIDQKFVPASGILTFKLKNRGGGIGKTEVYLNGKLVVPDARDEKLKLNPDVAGETALLTVDLKGANFLKESDNKISIVASNFIKEIGKGNIQSRGAEIFFKNEDKKEFTLPTLYAIVGGISKYDGEGINLRFAAKDAEDFSSALILGAHRLFCPKGNLNCIDKVQVKTLSTLRQKPEEQPTKENFKKAFAEIAQKAGSDDIIVIYLAGHGVSLGTGTDTYFYLTKEARSASKDDLARTFQTVAISSEELTDWLTQTEWVPGQKGIKPLKQVLILDTCAAGSAAAQLTLTAKRDLSGDQIRAIEFLKDKTGTFILMGSAADAPSYEAGKYAQGLLTYSLLQAMKGGELDAGGFIDVQKLFSYAEQKVPALAKDIGGVQKPIVSSPLGSSFTIGLMTDEEKKQIILPTPKPLMLRPLLASPPINNDPLNLIPELRKRLDAESSYEVVRQRGGKEPLLIYVDNDNFPGAVRVTGTYSVQGDKVSLKAYLIKDDKILAELPEIVAEQSKVLDELLKLVRVELSKTTVN
jgi:WD40 repeat protein/uncharacterized caspase-like protein